MAGRIDREARWGARRTWSALRRGHGLTSWGRIEGRVGGMPARLVIYPEGISVRQRGMLRMVGGEGPLMVMVCLFLGALFAVLALIDDSWFNWGLVGLLVLMAVGTLVIMGVAYARTRDLAVEEVAILALPGASGVRPEPESMRRFWGRLIELEEAEHGRERVDEALQHYLSEGWRRSRAPFPAPFAGLVEQRLLGAAVKEEATHDGR